MISVTEMVSNQTYCKCQHCGQWTNHASDPYFKALLIERDTLAKQVKDLRHAARLIARRRTMISGSLEMAECDEFCKQLGLRPWDMDWFGNQKQYEDGQPCPHPGCLAHVSHPCEGCGRVAGRTED